MTVFLLSYVYINVDSGIAREKFQGRANVGVASECVENEPCVMSRE